MSRPVLMPSGMDELWSAMERYPAALIFSGGTDALPRLRRNVIDPPALICLERIGELRSLEERDGGLFIGACVTHETLLRDTCIARRWPVLYQALRVLGSPHIRHMGTIGGNIVTASPAGDTLPPLYIFDAELEIRSPQGCRRTPIRGFITDPGKTILQTGEVLTGVWAPALDDGYNLQYYEKVGQRNALAISVVSLAAGLKIGEDDVIEDARLAWGSVGPTVIRSEEIERSLRGKPLSSDTMSWAAEMAYGAVRPISDVRAGAEYRRRVAGNLLLRLPEVWGSRRSGHGAGPKDGGAVSAV